jgi:uncharacterized delta-60 repeat protein
LWLFSTLLLSTIGFAQVTEEWVVRETAPGVWDGARSLALDNAGNVYVTGSADHTATGTGMDYLTIKYNSAGIKLWEAVYNGTANMDDDAFSIAVDGNGNVYVTGRGVGTAGQEFATIKYNTNGVLQWVARHNGEGRWIAVDGEGNVYVTGSNYGIGTEADITTIKYNTNGVEQWVAIYDGAGRTDAANALALDAAGNVYVTGKSAAGVDLDEEDADYTTIKYDSNGNELWVKKYDGPVAGNLYDEALAITLDASGNVYVTGRSSGSDAEASNDYATVKYDTDGNELWSVRYNGPGNSIDQALAISVDNANNVYVTGYSAAAADETNYDYATIKYDANGNQVWLNRYNGPANQNDQATSLTLDDEGNVYVTGRSTGTGTGYDFATIKYNTAGAQQWVARYNGPASGDDGTGIFIGFFTSHPIAVDTTGNVYVTGMSTGVASGFDYTTIKYSQAVMACGEKGDKILICHKGKTTLCISSSAVANHLAHGDQLGACAVSASDARITQSSFTNEIPQHFRVSVIPNPATVTTKIFYELPVDGRVSIKVFDMLGRQIKTFADANKQAGFHNAALLNVTALQKGMYYYQITVRTAKEVWYNTGKINVN